LRGSNSLIEIVSRGRNWVDVVRCESRTDGGDYGGGCVVVVGVEIGDKDGSGVRVGWMFIRALGGDSGRLGDDSYGGSSCVVAVTVRRSATGSTRPASLGTIDFETRS
jgi:hypothetical protein